MVAEGIYRADLYYRLNEYTVRIPALRDRGDDSPLLAEDLVRRYTRESGKEARGVSPEAMEIHRRYPWPGHRPRTPMRGQTGPARHNRTGRLTRVPVSRPGG